MENEVQFVGSKKLIQVDYTKTDEKCLGHELGNTAIKDKIFCNVDSSMDRFSIGHVFLVQFLDAIASLEFGYESK